MLEIIQPYLTYILPPVIGGFIGYLTNRIAIRMLFRPLKPWKVCGIRIPMTPGVIPSKRHELAINMGEMVGEHLLTSREIRKGIKKETFQEHLFQLIHNKVKRILATDYGPIRTIIPKRYQSYYFVAVQTAKYQIREKIHSYFHSKDFEILVKRQVDMNLRKIEGMKFKDVVTGKEREAIYKFLDDKISLFLSSSEVENWVGEFVRNKTYSVLQNRSSLDQIAPDSIKKFLFSTIDDHTGPLLSKFGEMAAEPEIRQKIVAGITKGIEEFIQTLGPMAAMVSGFLSKDTIEEKINAYLLKNKDTIVSALQNEQIQERVKSVLQEKVVALIESPIIEFLPGSYETSIEQFCEQLTQQITFILAGKNSSVTILSLIKNQLETHLEKNNPELGEIFQDCFGIENSHAAKEWLIEECIAIARTKDSLKTVESVTGSMIDELLNKEVGKLDRILPKGVVEGMSLSIKRLASKMLVDEVPGILNSLNIQQIVTSKIDSLDLLKLEKLLLTIMSEQFKYINLFGALLGFLIGCFNALIFIFI